MDALNWNYPLKIVLNDSVILGESDILILKIENLFMLKRNLHNIDRIIRVVLGLGLVYVGFIEPSVIGNDIAAILLGLFGVVNIGAGLVAHCPVYNLAGISTHKNLDENSEES